MKKENLDRLFRDGVAFDTETHLSQPGLLAPPLVCGSIAILFDPTASAIPGTAHPGIQGEALDRDAIYEAFISLLEGDKIILGAHIAFDMLVMATYAAKKKKRDIMPLIFAKYEREEVYDVLIGAALNAIADGCLGMDPHTGSDLRNPKNNKPQKYYSLDIVTGLELNRFDAKANDEWRLKYFLLEDIPIADWPLAATSYMIDDASNTAEDAFAQCGFVPKRSKHRWVTNADNKTVCSLCASFAAEGAGSSCFITERHRNLHQMSDQAYTAFALHLGAAWGFNVDQTTVDTVEKVVLVQREKASLPLINAGILKWKKDKGEVKLGKSKTVLARLVAQSHGATGECSFCNGTGKVVSAKKKMPTRREWDPEKDGINCKECCATGFDLSTASGLTFTDPSEMYPKGNIAADRDTLTESGDETLRELAEYEADAKTVTNYVPYLRTAQTSVTDSDGKVTWYRRPLTLRPNVLLETDRVSYADAIQQFPRASGHLENTEEFEIVEVLDDYVLRKGETLC